MHAPSQLQAATTSSLVVRPGSVVLTVGPARSGKSSTVESWHANGLNEYAVLSGDRNREQLGNDRRRQDIDHLVWRRVHRDLEDRLSIGLTTVVDGTNLTPERRAPVVEVARRAGAPLIAVRFDVPLETLRWHNTLGPEHERVPDAVLVRHRDQFDAHCSVAVLAREADLVVTAGLRLRFERDYDASAWDRL